MSIRKKVGDFWFNFKFIFLNRDSLRKKIYMDVYKGVLLSAFFTFFWFSVYYLLIIVNIDKFITGVIVYIFNVITFGIVMHFIVYRSIKKHIITRISDLYFEIDKIKQGNYTNRIKVSGKDEIDWEFMIINDLLDMIEYIKEEERNVVLIDSVTGCYNQRALEIMSDEVLALCERNEVPFVLCFYRIRNFGLLQNELSESQRDEMLRLFCSVIKKRVRVYDKVFYVDNGQFVVILIGEGRDVLIKLFERIRVSLDKDLEVILKDMFEKVSFVYDYVLSEDYDLKKKGVFDDMFEDVVRNVRKKVRIKR